MLAWVQVSTLIIILRFVGKWRNSSFCTIQINSTTNHLRERERENIWRILNSVLDLKCSSCFSLKLVLSEMNEKMNGTKWPLDKSLLCHTNNDTECEMFYVKSAPIRNGFIRRIEKLNKMEREPTVKFHYSTWNT